MPSDNNNLEQTWQDPITPPLLQDGSDLPSQSHEPEMRDISDAPLAQKSAEAIQARHEPEPADDLLKQLWEAIKLIIIPLLFASITGLAILPAIFVKHAYFPLEILWVVIPAIIIIAFMQGLAVHRTKRIAGMWILCTIGSFELLFFLSIFVLFGPALGILLAILLAAPTAYFVMRSFRPVPEGVVDIVLSYGKYKRTLFSGFNLLCPWEKVAYQVNIQETHWNCPPQKIQLSREDDIILQALISYQVVPQSAHLAVTKVKDWEGSLRETFIAIFQTIASVFTPEDFLSWSQSLQDYQQKLHHHFSQQLIEDVSESEERRKAINDYLCQYLRTKVESWGIQINWVTIRDIELVPHALPESQQPSQPSYEQQHIQFNILPSPHEPKPVFTGPAEQNKVIQLSEEVLIRAYKEVQDGKITDPESIRGIAAKFDSIAQDPEKNKSVSFDAERAARNLYLRARKFEELAAQG